MCFSFNLPDRKSNRLARWDYRWGGIYFVTICTANRQSLFGSVEDDEVALNAFGQIAEEEWRRTADVRPEVMLGEHVVMPNHLHGLISLGETDATESRISSTLQAGSLGAIVGQFKARVAKRINVLRGRSSPAIWQRGYFDRIIRDDAELQAIREYILSNPARWTWDHENPDR
ncbi:MAG: transposase [Thermoanaerobaculia bacterium]